MKSIQTKFIILILIGIVATELLTSTIGIYSYTQVLKSDSEQIMDATAGESAQELNALFGRIEQSVDLMAKHALDHLESSEKLINDAAYLEQYTADIEELGLTVANETSGAIGVYIRYNPDTMPVDSGFFRIRSLGEKKFHSIEVTDFSKYEKDDTEHVGWYYEPVENGKPTWMLPYYNKNIDVYMISYVVPLYKDGETIGIIGMDIDFEYIKEQVDAISVYETGHAFLTDLQYSIVHSQQYEAGTKVLPEKVAVVYKTLENNMCLGVAVPQEEIMQKADNMVMSISVASFLAILLAVFVTILVTKTIVKPLKQLNLAAQQISGGNLEVVITCESDDEVGQLAKSLQETTHELKKRIDYINNLAYVDELTGMKNNTAYWQEVSRLKESGESNYTVAVIDLNGLKQINDMFGHHCGNELIITMSKLVADVFGYENSYRAGGDEFLVLLTSGEGEIETLLAAFKEKINKQDGKIRAQAAIGYAVQSEKEAYEDVFKKADERMYVDKEKMKKSGKNSSVFL